MTYLNERYPQLTFADTRSIRHDIGRYSLYRLFNGQEFNLYIEGYEGDSAQEIDESVIVVVASGVCCPTTYLYAEVNSDNEMVHHVLNNHRVLAALRHLERNPKQYSPSCLASYALQSPMSVVVFSGDRVSRQKAEAMVNLLLDK